jgi:hypothetical protein
MLQFHEQSPERTGQSWPENHFSLPSDPKNMERGEIIAGMVTAFCLQLLAIWPTRSVYLVLQDEGNMLAWASRIIKGQLPYEDFFMRFMPATMYGLSFFFQVLGEQIWVARLYFMLSLALLCAVIWLVSRFLMPRSWSIVPPLLFICVGGQMFPMAVYHWDSSIPALLAILISAGAGKPKHQFWAGLLGGITVLFLQPRGVAVCLALGLMVLTRKKERISGLAYLVSGAAVPGLLFVLWLVAHGNFARFWNQAILFNVQGYAEAQAYAFEWDLTSRQLESIWQGMGNFGHIDFFSWLGWFLKAVSFAAVDFIKYVGFFPLLVIFAVDFGLHQRKSEDMTESQKTLLLGLQLLLWISAYFAWSRATRYHFNFLTVAWYPLLVYLLYRLRFKVLAHTLCGVVATVFVIHGADNITSWSEYRYPIEFPRGTLYASHPGVGQATQQLSQALSRDFQHRDLFAFPELPLIVWLVEANNPTSFERLVPIYYPEELLAKAERQIRDADRCGILFLSVADSIRSEYPKMDPARFQAEEQELLKRLTKDADPLGRIWQYQVFRHR